ncbi:hypothetical protein DRE_03497 [Drechslerella stenobrocha 248]|uniref:Lumenal Hsp70 protein n=1 Tax=Drechslerella stenobrocha 248 TaxID=1043628 RepID=W7I4P4_9PEZI|nr:hypothetical protein DRE_03497 [Drechslerella stenobrocha 248]
MRYSDRTTTLAVLVFVFASLVSASASILGIDYGTEFIKAALVKPGIPIEIVLTKDSKRKEVAAVAFKPKSSTSPANSSPERLYGVDAVNFAARFPDDVYPNLKQLLGVYDIGNEQLKSYANRFPSLKLKLASTPGRSTVQFHSTASPDETFSLEELVAMQLRSIRRSGEELANDGNTITDCMITVPAYFTTEERHTIIAASEMAGMNVMELISDGVAVALNYAMTRSYTPEAKPEVHIIYDMGAGSTTATVVQIRGKIVKDGRVNKTVTDVSTLGVGFDRSLGGDAFNQKMFDMLLNEFAESKAGKKLAEKEGKPIKDMLTGKQIAKLWKEASRVRHILSANTEAVSSIESFFPDIDFRSRKIQRSEFEEQLKEYIVRISKPIIDSVNKLKGGLENVESVILFGGAVRVPFVQKVLTDLLGDRLSKNVNGDEAAVMGATFRGASLSKLFRVKDIRVQDVSSYTLGMTYKSEETGEDVKEALFPAPAWRDHNRVVPFKMTDEFSFDIWQILGHQLDAKAPREQIYKVTTTNLTASLAKLKADVNCFGDTLVTNFNVRVGGKFGFPEITSAEVSCEYDEKKAGLVDDVKGFFGFGKDKDQKVIKDDAQASSSSSSSSKSAESSSTTKTTKSKSKTKSAAPIPTGVNGKPVETVPVAFTVERAGLSPQPAEEITASKSKLKTFDQDDLTRAQREEARNNLEASTYRATEFLGSDAFIAVSTEAQREALQAKINEISDWIYTRDADLATREILLAKFKELKDHEEPISKRRKEAEQRPDGVKRLKTNIQDAHKLVEKMKKAVEKHGRDLTSWSSYSTKFVQSVSSSSSSAAAASSSSAAEAEASKAAQASSTTAEASAPSGSGDPLDDLEESSSSSSSSSSTTKSTKTKSRSTTKKLPTPTPAPTVLYTEKDYKDLESTVQESEKWLGETNEQQSALKPHEDPVLLFKDLSSRSNKLEQELRKLNGRTKSNYAPPPPPPPPRKSKDRIAREAEARELFKIDGLGDVQGLAEGVDRLIGTMPDDELDKMIANMREEAEKERLKQEQGETGEGEKKEGEPETQPEGEAKPSGHDEL